MHEVWKRKQVHDARKMHRIKIVVEKIGKTEKVSPGRPRFGKKSGQTRGGPDFVSEMLGLREAENATQVN